jgi:hypothetical protein
MNPFYVPVKRRKIGDTPTFGSHEPDADDPGLALLSSSIDINLPMHSSTVPFSTTSRRQEPILIEDDEIPAIPSSILAKAQRQPKIKVAELSDFTESFKAPSGKRKRGDYVYLPPIRMKPAALRYLKQFWVLKPSGKKTDDLVPQPYILCPKYLPPEYRDAEDQDDSNGDNSYVCSNSIQSVYFPFQIDI